MRLIWALRSAVFVGWLTATVVPWAVLVVLLSSVLRGPRLYWFTVCWVRMAIWGARVICGVRHRVTGLDRVPTAAQKHHAVVLAAKHQSAWEAFALPTLMPHPLAYVFKRELLHLPFFGWALGRLDMVHIDRSRRAEAWQRVAAEGRRLAAAGVWVIIFPEGTRTARGRQGVYKAGAARLATATGLPIVPVAVSSAKCWPPRSFLLRPGVIDVAVGPPIESAGRDPDELMCEVERWIETEMRRLDPEAYSGPWVPMPPSRVPPHGVQT